MSSMQRTDKVTVTHTRSQEDPTRSLRVPWALKWGFREQRHSQMLPWTSWRPGTLGLVSGGAGTSPGNCPHSGLLLSGWRNPGPPSPGLPTLGLHTHQDPRILWRDPRLQSPAGVRQRPPVGRAAPEPPTSRSVRASGSWPGPPPGGSGRAPGTAPSTPPAGSRHRQLGAGAALASRQGAWGRGGREGRGTYLHTAAAPLPGGAGPSWRAVVTCPGACPAPAAPGGSGPAAPELGPHLGEAHQPPESVKTVPWVRPIQGRTARPTPSLPCATVVSARTKGRGWQKLAVLGAGAGVPARLSALGSC